MCWRGRTRSLNNFRFLILGCGEKQMHNTFRIWFGFSSSGNRKSKACPELSRSIQNLKWGGIVAIGITFAICVAVAQAQRPEKVRRVGHLAVNSPSADRHLDETFKRTLRELGWVEGQNITIQYRSAEGKTDRLPEIAAELVRLNVDVILSTGGTPGAQAAKKATGTIPIVFTSSGDPVATGLVTSLARPGGNVTGLSRVGPDLAAKKVELFKEILPKISRVAFIWNPANPANALALRETEAAAREVRWQLQSVKVRGPHEFEAAFSALTKARAAAVIVQSDQSFRGKLLQLAELAIKNRLPTMLPQSEYVDAGGLMSYGENLAERYRRAAVFVDKIPKGAKPADIPVEQPTKFELVINLKTAKQIGLTMPPNVLVRADRVIR
jgi:putative ABC transport system substrate-binding protein